MSELWHHGILGQRWGKKNGPPYPLDAGDHSASEKKAGWRKSLDKTDDHQGNKKRSQKSSDDASLKKRKGLTSGQKKALIITGATLATAAAAYGIYKYNQMNPDSVKRGRELLNNFIAKHGSTPMALLPEGAGEKATQAGKKIKESLDDSLRNANPLGKHDNCTACSISGILRMHGFNATARDCGEHDLTGIIQSVFKKARYADGATAVKFGRSPQDAAEMLLRRFGANASGVCGVNWKQGGGHAFSWMIRDGKVTFLDFQSALKGADLDRFWKSINPNGPLHLARLDDALEDIDFAELGKYVDLH